MEKESKKLLPMGTILTIDDYDGEVMVMSRNCEATDGAVYDYGICCYPEGEDYGNACINSDKIKEVLHLGYVSDEKERADALEAASSFTVKENKDAPNPSRHFPLGAIIRFTETGELVMISGHAGEGEDSHVHEYQGYRCPDGDAECVFDFDNKDCELVFEGFVDEAAHEYMSNLDRAIEAVFREENDIVGKIISKLFL